MITKHIDEFIAHRIATNSSNVNVFDKYKMEYETAPKKEWNV